MSKVYFKGISKKCPKCFKYVLMNFYIAILFLQGTHCSFMSSRRAGWVFIWCKNTFLVTKSFKWLNYLTAEQHSLHLHHHHVSPGPSRQCIQPHSSTDKINDEVLVVGMKALSCDFHYAIENWKLNSVKNMKMYFESALLSNY